MFGETFPAGSKLARMYAPPRVGGGYAPNPFAGAGGMPPQGMPTPGCAQGGRAGVFKMTCTY